MFGLIPRTVWSRSVPADDRGRITVQHNCLLLERSGDAPPECPSAPKLAMIEVGTGDKLDAKSKDLFALSDRTVLDALHEVRCDAASIGAVVTTHLHFDHSGALTRLCRAGETPDWTGTASGMAGSRADHGVKRTFPAATVYAQSREWDDALANRSVMTRTYFADHLHPLREQVRLVDSPRPFPTGLVPGRDDAPLGTALQRSTPLPGLPGVHVFLAPGHTWGQQAVWFEDTKGRRVVFTPDVMPTAAHVGATYNLAYDVEPYTSMTTRRWYLNDAADGDWLLVLDHEPGNPVRRVRANQKGWYELVPDAP